MIPNRSHDRRRFFGVLDEAAHPTRERISGDQARASRKIAPLLAYIGEHLFDPTLNVNQLKEACGVRDNSIGLYFHGEVGLRPHAYISECRLETAARLLRDTDILVWQIAELVGYSGLQVFSRAFRNWSGQLPTAYRKEQRTDAPSDGLPPEDELMSVRYWRRAMGGTLENDEAARLIEHLESLYPS